MHGNDKGTVHEMTQGKGHGIAKKFRKVLDKSWEGILGEPNKSDSALQVSCLANSIYKE